MKIIYRTSCFTFASVILFCIFIKILNTKLIEKIQSIELFFSYTDLIKNYGKGIINYRQRNFQKNAVSEISTLLTTIDPMSESSKFKIILMWNTWNDFMLDGPLVNAQCPVTECIFTRDESLLNQSDVIVLYIQTMVNFPVNRNPNQRFVFAQLESPITHDLPMILNDHRVRYGYFNWTMTYRWDSDIVHRGEYGYIAKKSTSNNTGIQNRILSDWSFQMTNTSQQAELDESTDSKFVKNVIKRKTKLVAWFVSHCSTPVRREEYIRQLNQYLPIDIFGGCNKQECPYSCNDMLHNEYKFYLAFENSWCQDYVTEKLYRPLIHNTVPIVMGGANYRRFAPPHSYINARDFSSPKKLAEYILLLNKNENLYIKYFEWKKHFVILPVDNYGLCDICQMAHDITLPPKTYTDIKQWWLGNGNCENDTTIYF